mmetsp:Transcript_21427/g.66480  ORF Transcript_21427/g.66480 Transcript_21427/m.66480 type:complete len:206 (-) Transcript_21427:8-625(-)
MHRVVDRATDGVAVEVARVAAHEDVADALVEDDLDGHARVRASEEHPHGHLPPHELPALNRRHVGRGRLGRARPEARVACLDVRQNLARRLGLHRGVAALLEELDILEGKRQPAVCRAGAPASGHCRARLLRLGHLRLHGLRGLGRRRRLARWLVVREQHEDDKANVEEEKQSRNAADAEEEDALAAENEEGLIAARHDLPAHRP